MRQHIIVLYISGTNTIVLTVFFYLLWKTAKYFILNTAGERNNRFSCIIRRQKKLDGLSKSRHGYFILISTTVWIIWYLILNQSNWYISKMAILPPDPIFCFKGDMGHIHSLCFPVKNDNYCSQILSATEKGIVYFWDLEVSMKEKISIKCLKLLTDTIY